MTNTRTPEEIANEIYSYADEEYFTECLKKHQQEKSSIRLTEAVTINGGITFPAGSKLRILPN
jgi:hypothetical protein